MSVSKSNLIHLLPSHLQPSYPYFGGVTDGAGTMGGDRNGEFCQGAVVTRSHECWSCVWEHEGGSRRAELVASFRLPWNRVIVGDKSLWKAGFPTGGLHQLLLILNGRSVSDVVRDCDTTFQEPKRVAS